MADTGAPWNIPYVEPTDTPRSYPQDSEDLALAVAAGLSAAENAGIGSNVVSVTKTDVFTTTSTSLVDVTGLTVTITPSSDTAKVLVLVDLGITANNNQSNQGYVLVRDSTIIAQATGGVGEYTGTFSAFATGSNFIMFHPSLAHLDSPAKDTAVTYKVQVVTAGGTIYVNRMDSQDNRQVSTLTVIEVAT